MLPAGGLSGAGTAAHPHLGSGAARTHTGRLPAKLRARDRAQLAIGAYESGLVTAAPRTGP